MAFARVHRMDTSFRGWAFAWRGVVAVAAFGIASGAAAQVAFTTQATNMRAGPDREFPLVAWIAPNTPVQVFGCVNGWRWCDVQWGPNRGWVYAGFLSYTWNNQPTIILQGGPVLGLPLVTWSIGPYWDSYYRNRPWWGNRAYWYNRPPPHRPPAYVPPPNRPPHYQPAPTQPPRPGPGYRPPPSGGSPGRRPPESGRPPNQGGGGRPPDAGRPPNQGGGGGGHPPGGGNRPPPSRPPDTNNPQQ
ncbi:MAG: SH3 domain-containing protein [Burkholderiales bacterium]